ncbi:MAG: DUF5668 domain-containing protein [bacterium]|nr:DUF5668 domain-containing protein [bacterium]
MCSGSCGKCGCLHHKTVPVFITLIGLSFLLTALGVLGEVTNSYVWPVLLILIGLQKLLGGMCKCCDDKGACGTESGGAKAGGGDSCCGGK